MIQVFAANYRSPALTTPPSGLIVFSLPKDAEEITLVKIYFNQPIEGDAEFNLQLEGVNIFGSNLEIADGDESVTSDPLSVAVNAEDKLSLDFPVLPDSFTYPINLEVYYDDGLGTAVYKEYVDSQDAATLASAQSYTDSHVVGLWDDRGSFDASGNAFPSSGGSGSAGAIKKGDIWTISVAGTLGGHPVTAGDTVRALIDTPGSTDANWAIAENNIGYVPENQANKSTDGTFADNSDTDYPSEKAAKKYVDDAIALISNVPSGTTQTGIISGGQVTWISDYDFKVAAAIYKINGVTYSSAETVVSLATADATDPRFDSLVLTSSNTADKVTGTPAAQPSKPDIDPATQLELTFVLVEAASTEPATADSETVYEEGAGGEWTDTTSGTGINTTSTNNPRTGSNCVEVTSGSNGSYLLLTRATPTDLSDFNTFRFYLRSKAQVSNNKFIRGQFFLNGVAVGNALTIGQNTISSFGFDSSNTSSYQLISIPISQFVIPAGATVDQFRLTNVGAGLGYYADDFALVNTGTVIVSGTSGLTEEQADARYLQQGLSNYASKTTPIDADSWMLFDSVSALWARVTGTNLKAYLKTYFDTLYASVTGGSETTTTLGSLINSAGAATPNNGDFVATAESGGLLKKITWTNVKAFLKTYFDTLYQATLVSGTSIKTVNSTSLLGSGDVAVQPLDSDLTTIAGLTATTDNFIQAKSSAWASRTVAQVSADLQGTGLITDAVGFRTIPQNSQSTAYTTVAADAGKHILHPAADTNARTFTIDSNANVAYPIGTAITFVNETSQVVTIAITSDTLTLAGTTTTGSRTLAQNGVATAIKVTSTKWIISGTGLT